MILIGHGASHATGANAAMQPIEMGADGTSSFVPISSNIPAPISTLHMTQSAWWKKPNPASQESASSAMPIQARFIGWSLRR